MQLAKANWAEGLCQALSGTAVRPVTVSDDRGPALCGNAVQTRFLRPSHCFP